MSCTGLVEAHGAPWEGHEFKFGGIFQEDHYNIGQYNRGPTTTAAHAGARSRARRSIASEVKNYTGTANWTYSRPDDKLFNWDANVYWNRVDNDQVKIYNNRITIGAIRRLFAHQSRQQHLGLRRRSRAAICSIRIGLRRQQHVALRCRRLAQRHHLRRRWLPGRRDDDANARGNSNVTTPGGVRTVTGGFAQLKQNYSTWLEVIGAIRYDNYQLEQFATSPPGRTLLAEDHGRRDAFPRLHALRQLRRRLSRAVDHRDADRGRACHRRRSALLRLPRRHRRPVLLPAQSGAAAGSRQEQGSGSQPEVRQHLLAGRQLPRQVQCVPQRCRGLHRPRRVDADAVPPFGSFSQFYQYQNIAQRPYPGLRGRDHVRRRRLVRRRRWPDPRATTTSPISD